MMFCRNSKAAHFSPSKRFVEQSKLKIKFIPGPGQYEAKDYTDGVYTLSKFKNAGVRRFGTAARVLAVLNHTQRDMPGPGAYRVPSDFGYIESVKFSPRTTHY
jgi:Sperm-tail PG-rich repeat